MKIDRFLNELTLSKKNNIYLQQFAPNFVFNMFASNFTGGKITGKGNAYSRNYIIFKIFNTDHNKEGIGVKNGLYYTIIIKSILFSTNKNFN